MCGRLEDQALGAFARSDGRSGVATLENELGCFEIQSALGLRGVVAGETVVLQHGEKLLFKINGRLALEFSDQETGAIELSP